MSNGDADPVVRLESVVLIAVGGFAGSNLRYFAGFLTADLRATLAVNALGSFALGVVVYEARYSGRLAEETRTAVSTGFLSSFTTYSTFALASFGAGPALLALNVAANYGLGFAGVLAGRALARYTDRRWS